MHDVVFETTLLNDGHLDCPREYAVKNAHYKVIVSLPENESSESEIELAASLDASEDFSSPQERDYYLNLSEPQ